MSADARSRTEGADRSDGTSVDEREALHQLGEQSGWRRKEYDHIDVYVRGATRVRVIWRGTSAISGGSLFQDDVLATYTRELSTVNGWLNR
jgi:hypothetical protein